MQKHVRVGDHDAEQPDWFTGLGVAMGQMANDIGSDLPMVFKRAQLAHAAKDEVLLKLKLEAYARHLRQMQDLANVCVGQCVERLARRPRA